MTRIRVNEASTQTVEFDILDENDAGVPAASLTSATLTLYDMDMADLASSPRTGILNARDAQDVLNTNDVAINASGHVVWTMQALDNVIVTARRQLERHRAAFDFVWPTGAFRFDVEIEVVNMRHA